MSTRPNPLREAVMGIQNKPAEKTPTVSVVPEPAPKVVRTTAPSRIGKRSVSGHFSPEVSRQLRILAAEADRTVQGLLEEALNDLFRKHEKSAIC